jgi:hypothetical protein
VTLFARQGEARPRYFEDFQISFFTRSREEDSSSDRRIEIKSPTQLYLQPLGNPRSSPDLEDFELLGSLGRRKWSRGRWKLGGAGEIGIDGAPSG